MGRFKVGDRVRVVDYPAMVGRVGTVTEERREGHSFSRVAFDSPALCELYVDDELEHVAPRATAVAPRRPAPVRRPKGRFTVRQGQTLRQPVNTLFDPNSLSGRRWYR